MIDHRILLTRRYFLCLILHYCSFFVLDFLFFFVALYAANF